MRISNNAINAVFLGGVMVLSGTIIYLGCKNARKEAEAQAEADKVAYEYAKTLNSYDAARYLRDYETSKRLARSQKESERWQARYNLERMLHLLDNIRRDVNVNNRQAQRYGTDPGFWA